MKIIILLVLAFMMVSLHVVALQVVANSTIGFTLHRFQTLVHPVLKVGFEGCMKGFIDVIHLKKMVEMTRKTWSTEKMRKPG